MTTCPLTALFRMLFVAFFLLQIIAARCPAQNAEPRDATASEEPAGGATGDAAVRQELTKLKEVYEKACAAGDPSLLKPHLDPDFSGVMVTSEEVHSFNDVQRYWDWVSSQLGKGGKYNVLVAVEDKSIIDGNTALAHGTTQDHAVTAAGREFKFQGKWTAVCRRNDDGQWKILRIHGSINPIDNPFIAAMGMGGKVIVGIVTGILGLLVGFIGARIAGRNSKSAAQK